MSFRSSLQFRIVHQHAMKIQLTNGFGPCQTAQADINRYCSQMYLNSFSQSKAAIYIPLCPLPLFGSVINPFPNKPWFARVYSTSLLKILLEKEKLLILGNFSFPHSVFYLFLEDFSPFSSNLKFSLSVSMSFKVSKISCFGKVYNGLHHAISMTDL